MTCNCHLEKLLGRKPKANIKPIGYPQEGPCEHTTISIFVTTLTFVYHITCQEHCLVVANLVTVLVASQELQTGVILAVSCPGNSSKQGSEEGSATVLPC